MLRWHPHKPSKGWVIYWIILLTLATIYLIAQIIVAVIYISRSHDIGYLLSFFPVLFVVFMSVLGVSFSYSSYKDAKKTKDQNKSEQGK